MLHNRATLYLEITKPSEEKYRLLRSSSNQQLRPSQQKLDGLGIEPKTSRKLQCMQSGRSTTELHAPVFGTQWVPISRYPNPVLPCLFSLLFHRRFRPKRNRRHLKAEEKSKEDLGEREFRVGGWIFWPGICVII